VTRRRRALAAAGLVVFLSTAAGAQARPVTLTWVGDMAFSSQKGLPPGGPRAALAAIRPALRAPGLTLGNLEGTLSRGGTSKCARIRGGNCFAFQAPPAFAHGFRRAGLDLLNLANNHSHDYGDSGLRQTRVALRRAGIPHTGLGREITVRKVNGVRVAFMGFAPYRWAANLLDIRGAQRLVRAARRRAKLVVVVIHAGAEGAGALHVPLGPEVAFGENRGRTRAFAHAVVGAGADVVLGSGPHVLRGMECYRRRLIAYSLGDFAAWHTLSTAGVQDLSGVLHVTLRPRGTLRRATLVPVRLTRPGLPRRDRGGASVSLVRRLSHQDFGRRACRVHRG
jgi:poly-gamma-glutamate capsule biosynthesis protein CapA/YwtB (metallophosphatase superfamily)